jgi:hypothetical protein
LSAIPCEDNAIVNAEQLTSISQNSDNEKQDTNDLCSPFSICASCTGITLEPNIQQDALISETLTKELNTYFVSFSSNYLSQIYHPPQV